MDSRAARAHESHRVSQHGTEGVDTMVMRAQTKKVDCASRARSRKQRVVRDRVGDEHGDERHEVDRKISRRMVGLGQQIALHASWYPPVFLLDDVPMLLLMQRRKTKKTTDERSKAGAARC